MDERVRLKWAAATGYLSLALGMAGAAFERGAPTVQAPVEEVIAFFAAYPTELRWQSFFFILSAGVSYWFYGALRGYLCRYEEGDRLATVAFTAGVTGMIIQFVMQSVQATAATMAGPEMSPDLVVWFGTFGFLMTVVAYIPAAVLYAATGIVGLRHRALPAWLSWFSLVWGLFLVVMFAGLVVESGPLVPGAPLTYLLYLGMMVWMPAMATVMISRLERPVR